MKKLIVFGVALLLCYSRVFGAMPDKIFAPYVDVTLWPTFDLMTAYEATGQKYYTLAFIVANSSGEPSWGSYYDMDEGFMSDQISEIREVGGDVIISFGGASGTPIASSITSTESLVDAYETVIETYDVTWIDFDIEGTWVQDDASIARRNDAAAILQSEYPDLRITYCLPVMPSGLTTDGLAVIEDAVDAGVDIYGVNIMAMDYGQSNSAMGEAAISAAENAYSQTGQNIGITPMIGQNDTQNEIFSLDNAEELLSFAQSTSWVNMLAMWSMARDNGDCAGTTSASSTCSGVTQDDFEFTSIFYSFTGTSTDDDSDSNGEEFTPSTSKWYVLTNRKSGLNMRIADCNTASETNLELYDGTGTCAQWRFIENNGVWTIQNRESGLNIRHDGETVVSDETLAEMISTNGDRTYFKVYQSPKSGYYNIQHVGSGFNLRNNDCETENDATTIEFFDGDGECAQWQFVEAADITGEFSTKIEAEDFSSYSGVETEDCDEGGENVGYIETGDWMLYSDVEIPYSGTYTFSYRVASESTGGQLSLDYSSGSVIVDYVDVPVTGAWQTWSTVTSSVTLDAGTYDFGIYAQEGGWNFNWFSIAYTGTKSTKEDNDFNFNEEKECKITIYPNPVTDFLNIEGVDANSTLMIYSVSGELIKSDTGNSINVSDLKSGIYIVHVSNGVTTKSLQFIKK